MSTSKATTSATGAIMYTIYYFPLAGRAEVARMILEVTGIPYTNKYPVDWPAEQSSTPFGQLPLLFLSDPAGEQVTLAQSHAINRFLAARHGLIPDGGPVQLALADSVEESVRQLFEEMIGTFFYGYDEEGLKKALDVFKHKELVAFVDSHQKLLKANGSNGFYFGNNLTYVELMLYTAINMANKVFGEGTISEVNAPELMQAYKVVATHPKLVEYWQSDRYHKKFFLALDF